MTIIISQPFVNNNFVPLHCGAYIHYNMLQCFNSKRTKTYYYLQQQTYWCTINYLMSMATRYCCRKWIGFSGLKYNRHYNKLYDRRQESCASVQCRGFTIHQSLIISYWCTRELISYCPYGHDYESCGIR